MVAIRRAGVRERPEHLLSSEPPPGPGRGKDGAALPPKKFYSMIIFGMVIENIVPLSISELTSIEP
jgi:hypothetical protein